MQSLSVFEKSINMITTSAYATLLFLTAHAPSIALTPRDCKSRALNLYQDTNCADYAQGTSAIPPCATADSTDAPDKYQSFKLVSTDGCSLDALLEIICNSDPTGSCFGESVSAMTVGACVHVTSGSDYIKGMNFIAAGG